MLREATKKAIATLLKLNADRCSTYPQMKWQVVSQVNMKLPSCRANTQTRVKQGDDENRTGLEHRLLREDAERQG